MTDIELGKFVVETFLRFQNGIFFLFSNNTLADVLATQKHPENFLDGLGLQYRLVLDLKQSALDDSMQSLANASNGNIPTLASFQKAIRDRAMNPSFFEAASAVASGTASEVGAGAQALGNNLIDTAKILNALLPLIILGGVGYTIFKNRNILVLKK